MKVEAVKKEAEEEAARKAAEAKQAAGHFNYQISCTTKLRSFRE